MTELANINTDSYENLARAMGMATDKPAKRSNTLNRLRIWHSPIMGKAEINGKLSNIEVVEGGCYRLEIIKEDSSTFLYSKNITIRPFMQRFMLKRYVANASAKGGEPKGSFHRTIMADSLNMDLKDNTGRFNCGKPSGYVQDFQALPKDMQDLIRQIKRVRVVFGTVTLDSPVDDKGILVEDGTDFPFIWKLTTRMLLKYLVISLQSFLLSLYYQFNMRYILMALMLILCQMVVSFTHLLLKLISLQVSI